MVLFIFLEKQNNYKQILNKNLKRNRKSKNNSIQKQNKARPCYNEQGLVTLIYAFNSISNRQSPLSIRLPAAT